MSLSAISRTKSEDGRFPFTVPAIGSADVPRDDTLEAQRRLGKALRLSWAKRVTCGFFLRAEDFFGFTKRLARERAELMLEMREAAEQYRAGDRSRTALGLKQGPLAASLAEMEKRYGARSYSVDVTPVGAVAYEDLDHVRLTRDSLNAPERYLNRILERGTPSPQRGEGAQG